MDKNTSAIWMAVLAAAMYAVSVPVSKVFLEAVPPTVMAAFLYIGAGVGMAVLLLLRKASNAPVREIPLSRSDSPYIFAAIGLDILACLLLMYGLRSAAGANASLLGNFEIVATAVLAMSFFHEKVSRRLWTAIAFVTAASILLTFGGKETFDFSPGSLLVLGATVCWGLENNVTRQIAGKDPMQIVLFDGLGTGAVTLLISLCIGDAFPTFKTLILIALLGFVSYGLSVCFYTLAQRSIGAAKTSTYYAVNPFIGVFLSIIFLGERPGLSFFIALSLMAVGAWLAKD